MVVLLGIIVLLVMKLRKKRQEGKASSTVADEQEKQQSTTYAYEAPPVEMFAEHRAVEIGGNHATELPGSDGYHVYTSPRRPS
jgi:hypothetical protein